MKEVFLLAFCLVMNYIVTGQSISISNNFEGGNINVISINNSENSISVSPALRTNDTKAVYFFFKIKGYSVSQPLEINLYTSESYYAPVLAGVSYNLINWFRTSAENYSGFKQYKFSASGDSLYFAVGYPYTYSNMLDYINSFTGNNNLTVSDIAVSEEGRAVKLLRITDPAYADSNKKLVWIIARQHAFECHSNYVVEGIINELLSEDANASRLRKQSIIYFVPIMDVDKVYNGGTGKDQNPVDFNRDWESPSYWNSVNAVKNKIQETAELNNLEVFIDSHDPFPGDTASSSRLLMYQTQDTGSGSFNADFFRDIFYEEGGYTIERQKLYFTEGQTSMEYVDSVYLPGLSFSLESGWIKRPDGIVWDITKYRQCGRFLLQALSSYINNIPFEDDIIIDNRDSSNVFYNGEWIPSSYIGGYFGEDFVHDNNIQKGLKSVSFVPPVTFSGYYEVFMRWTSAEGRASNVPVAIMHNEGTALLNINQKKLGAGWVSLGTFNFSSGSAGKIIIETTGTDGYVIADAVRLSKRNNIINIYSEGIQNPETLILYQNYPNPFNSETIIKYRIHQEEKITIKLFDLLGREIKTFINKEQGVGMYELKLRLDYLPSGIYFYRLSSSKYSAAKKLILLK